MNSLWLKVREEEEEEEEPVGFPDVQRLLVHVVVSQRLLVQEVEEVLDGWRDDGAGAQHAAEEVVHKLLQGALKERRSSALSFTLLFAFCSVSLAAGEDLTQR